MGKSKTENQRLRDHAIEPILEIIAEALGTANTAYIKFTDELANHDIELNWRYYNDGSAWLGKGQYKWTTSRGTAKETTAFWLSIWDGFFKVTVFVPEKVCAEALSLPLNAEVVEMVETAKQMRKLKFSPVVFDLVSDALFDDLYKLIDFRKMIK